MIGTGTQADPYRPDLDDRPAGSGYTCLMIHEAKQKAIVVMNTDTMPAKAGRTRLFTGLNLDDLKNKGRNTNPAAGVRTTINNWLTAGGFQTIPTQPYDAGEKNADGTTKLTPAPVTWREVVDFAIGQVNPGASLETIFV